MTAVSLSVEPVDYWIQIWWRQWKRYDDDDGGHIVDVAMCESCITVSIFGRTRITEIEI